MIEKEMWTMGEKEVKLEVILTSLGHKKNNARVLIYIFNFGHGYTREIEHTMNLKQPEVSVATKELVEEGLIKVKEEHHGRGRPKKRYILAKDKEQILEMMCKIGTDKIKEMEKNMMTLKHLL